MGVFVIAAVCGLATACIAKTLHKKFPMKEYLLTRECLWFAIFAILFLSGLFVIDPAAPNGSKTVIETAPVSRGKIMENSLTILACLPVLLVVACVLDRILMRVKKAFKKK